MANESTYWFNSEGVAFKKTARHCKKNAEPVEVAGMAIKGLRNDIRKNGGPVYLIPVARYSGVVNCGQSGALSLPIDQRTLGALAVREQGGGGSVSESSARTIEKEWMRIQYGDQSVRQPDDLLVEFLLEQIDTKLLSRLHGRIPDMSAADETSYFGQIKQEVRNRLRTCDKDFVDSLRIDPTGQTVRVRPKREKLSTKDLLAMPISQLFDQTP